jgi:hypothetical protein
MMEEPLVTHVGVKTIGLIEVFGGITPDFENLARGYEKLAFLVSRSSLALSWWFPEPEAGHAERELNAHLSGGTSLRVVGDLGGISVGIERLDYTPDLASRILAEFAAAGAHIQALQTGVSGLRLVTNGLFTRTRDVDTLVRAACYRWT